MEAFWNNMDGMSKSYFIIACIASLVLIIQLLMLIIGFASGGLGDVDGADFDAAGDTTSMGGTDTGAEIGAFILRGLVAFFAIGGWIGYAVASTGVHPAVTIIVSLAVGLAALVAVGFAYRAMYKLQESGNIDVVNAIGKTAEVYLTIPANGNGFGKVNMLLQERDVELEARTLFGEKIPTGSIVKIIETQGHYVIVEPFIVEKSK